MSKRARFGVVTKPKRDKPRKRPGRHSKKPKEEKNLMLGKEELDKNPLISYI